MLTHIEFNINSMLILKKCFMNFQIHPLMFCIKGYALHNTPKMNILSCIFLRFYFLMIGLQQFSETLYFFPINPS